MTPTPQDIPQAVGTVPGTCECPINAGSSSFPASELKGPLHALPHCTGDKPTSQVPGTGVITCPVHSLLRGDPVWLQECEQEVVLDSPSPPPPPLSLSSPAQVPNTKESSINKSLVFLSVSFFSFLSPLSKTAWRPLLPLSPRQFQRAHLILQK